MTVWKNIIGYEEYYVSDNGDVLSKRLVGKILSPLGKTQRYLKVRLYIKGKWVTRSIHQLVAEAFIPNPSNKPHINHINGNKFDNRSSNLEWCTPSENCKHRIHILGIRPKGKPRRPIIAYNDKEEIYFPSIFDAQKQGFTITAIYRSMRKDSGRFTHKNYKWKYA